LTISSPVTIVSPWSSTWYRTAWIGGRSARRSVTLLTDPDSGDHRRYYSDSEGTNEGISAEQRAPAEQAIRQDRSRAVESGAGPLCIQPPEQPRAMIIIGAEHHARFPAATAR